jgi:general secretion pathway protein G
MENGKRATRLAREKGFTLVEVIVIVAVIAILAGIVVPMIFKQIDESKLTRAEADCKSISSAILAFRKDTGVWPNLSGVPGSCTPGIGTLHGLGAFPQGLVAAGFDMASTLAIIDVLGMDTLGCYNAQKLKVPYLPQINADPWGNAYVVSASNFELDGQPVFVYSAGPNGILDTAIGELTPAADDIAIRVK